MGQITKRHKLRLIKLMLLTVTCDMSQRVDRRAPPVQLGPSTNYVTCKQNGCARLPQFAGLFLLLPMSDYCQNTDHSLTWESCGEDTKCHWATSTPLCPAGPVLEGSDELFNRQSTFSPVGSLSSNGLMCVCVCADGINLKYVLWCHFHI